MLAIPFSLSFIPTVATQWTLWNLRSPATHYGTSLNILQMQGVASSQAS
jgi:hypothetical protein